MGGEPRKLGNGFPRFPFSHKRDVIVTKPEAAGDINAPLSGVVPAANLRNDAGVQLGLVMPLTLRPASGSVAVLAVGRVGNPPQVLKSVVAHVEVDVIGLLTGERFAVEGDENKPVDPVCLCAVRPVERVGKISLGAAVQRANDFVWNGTNTPKVGNLKQGFKFRNRFPSFGGTMRVSHSLPSMGALVRAVVGVLAPGGSFVSGATLSRVSA